jgi:hypothetical protein
MKERFRGVFLTAGSLALFLVSAVLSVSCSSDSPQEINRTAEFPGDGGVTGTALLYVDRNSTITRIDGKSTGRSGIKGPANLTLAAGRHSFAVKWEYLFNKSDRDIELSADLEPDGFYGLTSYNYGTEVSYIVEKNKGRIPGETPGPGETELIFTQKKFFAYADQQFVYLDDMEEPFLAISTGETLRVFVPKGSHSIAVSPANYQYLEPTKWTETGFSKPFEFAANSSPVHIQITSRWPTPKVEGKE